MSEANIIHCGDNLSWMESIPNGSVDLCYIDPPFFSNANYEVIWGNSYEKRSFGDRFAGGIQHYIQWMKERLVLIHKKLKKSGSFYLHCDHHASHYLKVACDQVFGRDNFQNEIVWCYRKWTNASGHYQRNHDTILYYVKSSGAHVFHKTADPSAIGAHYAKGWHDNSVEEGGKRLRQLIVYDKAKAMHKIHSGAYDRVVYREAMEVALSDWWADINFLNSQAKERIGYNTQKPEALLRRIVLASSKPDDLVMDCFVGGGTTAKVCADENRRFICGDLSPVAVRVTASRLNAKCPKTPYRVDGIPQTEKALRAIPGHQFAELVCRCMGWDINDKKSADKGIDGWADNKKIPIQIKNHAKAIGRPEIQKFVGAIQGYKRGFFVAWEFSKQALEYIAEVQNEGLVVSPIRCKEDIFEDLMITQSEEAKLRKYFQNATDKQPKLDFYSPLTHA